MSNDQLQINLDLGLTNAHSQGTPKRPKDIFFYHTDEQKVFISLKVIFLEKKFLGEGIVASKVEFDEVQQEEGLTPIAEPESDLIRSNLELNVPAP